VGVYAVERMQALLGVLAHAGHPAYDHPAMAAIAIAAIVIPLGVLVGVARVFLRAAKRDSDRGDG
jgi:hypothetical protein